MSCRTVPKCHNCPQVSQPVESSRKSGQGPGAPSRGSQVHVRLVSQLKCCQSSCASEPSQNGEPETSEHDLSRSEALPDRDAAIACCQSTSLEPKCWCVSVSPSRPRSGTRVSGVSRSQSQTASASGEKPCPACFPTSCLRIC
jgi:hypothetical protein